MTASPNLSHALLYFLQEDRGTGFAEYALVAALVLAAGALLVLAVRKICLDHA